MFADLFWAMGQRGFTPQETRAMLMWEAAAVVGADVDRSQPEQAGPSESRSGRNLIKERIAHARGHGPRPVPDRTDPAVMAELTSRMGGDG